MATITTFRPYNMLDEPYTYIEGLDDPTASDSTGWSASMGYKFLQEMVHRIPNKIFNMPLFQQHTTGITTVGDVGRYAYPGVTSKFDAAPSSTFFIGHYDTNGNDRYIFGFDVYSSYDNTFSAYRTEYDAYMKTVNSVPARGSIRMDSMYSFRMTTYVAQNTNGFWLPNKSNWGKCNPKMILTKVTNMENPADVKYFPATFNYITNAMRSSGFDSVNYWTANVARIWDGGQFVFVYDTRQNKGGNSKSFTIKPYTLNEWKFTDVYTYEGNLPVFNTDGKIRIGNDNYLFLSNSFLLRITD
jgi:hypothetical protein